MPKTFKNLLILVLGIAVILMLTWAFVQFVFIPFWIKQTATTSAKLETKVESVIVNSTSTSPEKTFENDKLEGKDKTSAEEKSSLSSSVLSTSNQSVNTKSSSSSSSSSWQRGTSENQIAAYNI